MTPCVLLLSTDPALIARVRRALPAGLRCELQAAPLAPPAPPPRGWLLVVVDGALALTPPPSLGAILWLGRASQAEPWLAAGIPLLDCVGRDAPVSKLAFILAPHLATAYLHWVRSPLPFPGGGRERHQLELNNTASALLGNAELAFEQAVACASTPRPLPPPLTERLDRMVRLSVQLRELLLAPSDAPFDQHQPSV